MDFAQQQCMSFGKTIKLTQFGGFESWEICKIENTVHPVENQVLVEIQACGLNFSDLYVRMGLFTFHNIKPPLIMGSEAAGVISEIGEDVSDFKVGDRVLCWNFLYGLFAEHVLIPAEQCFHIPDKMTFQEAASIPINYITAYLAVIDFGHLQPGQSVFIQCAAGGVGCAATQLALTVKDVIIFGTASGFKLEKIKRNGVTHPIDYHSSDFVQEVLRISPTGVNVVVDCLSGRDFIRSQKLLKDMGRLIHVGANNVISGERTNWFRALKTWWQTKNISVIDLVHGNHAVCGINLANFHEHEPQVFRNLVGKILQLFNEGKVKPIIDSVWPFNQISEATDHMLNRKNIGKLILVPHLENGKTDEQA